MHYLNYLYHMKSTHHIFLNLLSTILSITFLLACNKKNDPIIQNNNWQTIYQNNDLDLFSIKFLDENNGYVLAGLSAVHTSSNWELILKTSDGGNHWIVDTCSFPTKNDSNREIFPLDNGILLGIGYHVYKSNDNGKTWTDVSPQFVYGDRIDDLYIIDSVTWFILQGAFILRTNDAGQTWQTVFHTDFMGVFQRFSFPSPSVGYANIGVIDLDIGASIGLIVKTSDGGHNWTIMNPEPWNSNGISIPYMNSMQFLTDQIGYISTYSESKMYKTVDGGNNWALVHNNNYTNGLEYFISENIGYYSDGVTAYVTNDGGKTWKVDYYNNDTNSDILTWIFLKSGKGYALTRDHRIIKKIN
jgi:photosystem II stability/assembly factor-like uncharacterized protein